MRVHFAILCAVALTGCTHWERNDAVLLQPIPERQTVEINVGAMRAVTHGIRVDSLKVSYVLKFQAPDCDSCRRSIPRASIDSIRVRSVSTPRTLILISALLFIIFVPDWPASDEPYT